MDLDVTGWEQRQSTKLLKSLCLFSSSSSEAERKSTLTKRCTARLSHLVGTKAIRNGTCFCHLTFCSFLWGCDCGSYRLAPRAILMGQNFTYSHHFSAGDYTLFGLRHPAPHKQSWDPLTDREATLTIQSLRLFTPSYRNSKEHKLINWKILFATNRTAPQTLRGRFSLQQWRVNDRMWHPDSPLDDSWLASQWHLWSTWESSCERQGCEGLVCRRSAQLLIHFNAKSLQKQHTGVTHALYTQLAVKLTAIIYSL